MKRTAATAGWASSPSVRAVMHSNKRRDTRPETAVRRLIHTAGLRYRVDYPPLPELRRRRADVVFTRAKVAVFIDGCFWHGCPEHYRPASQNASFWNAKRTANALRDEDTNARLEAAGWTVMRFWEHQAPSDVAAQIIASVRARSAKS